MGLGAADGAHNPTDRSDPIVVTPSKKGETEEADLVKERDCELPSGGRPKEDIADGEVMGRLGERVPQLVPRKSDGGTPVEEVFTGEFAAEADWAVTELTLLEENGRLAAPMGPGTGGGEAGEAAVANAGHAAGDEGPSVAGNARGRGASRAPRDARMVLAGSDPGGTHSQSTADAAVLGEIDTVSRRPSCDSTRDA